MKRKQNESYQEYREERKLVQQEIKERLKGNYFHKSKVVFFGLDWQEQQKHLRSSNFQSNGTYVKSKSKDKISFTKELRNKRGYSEHLKLRYSA